MDFLYVVGNGSRNANMELRWALRSLERFGRNVGRVVVAGNPPEWLHGVEKVCVRDEYPRKHKNIAKVLLGVLDAGVLDGDFILASDDVFYARPFDADAHPLWMKGKELPTEVPKGDERFKGYWNNLIASRRFMEDQGLPIVNFSTHANMRTSVRALKMGRQVIRESIETERGVDGWVLAGGLYTAFTEGVEPRYRKDVKIREVGSVGEVREMVGDGDCFSISDAAMQCEALWQYMTGLLGRYASKWE